MNLGSLKGKTILILGGSPKEVIDSVRYYANHARPEDHGHRAAAALVKTHAKVILLSPATHYKKTDGVEYISVKADAAAAAMLETAQTFLQRETVDAVLQLASISSLRPAHIFTTKLKVKKETGSNVPLEVIGNIDVAGHLRAAFPENTMLGYDNYQQFFEQGDSALRDALRPVIVTTREAIPNTKPTVSTVTSVPDGKLYGRKIIVTSGPTVEQLTKNGDIITNFSSGAQGVAIAESLAAMGANVTLISGPTHLPVPTHPHITTLRTEFAHRMWDAVIGQLPADAYIGVAAVADFGMPSPAPLMLKEDEAYTLMLTQNPDILRSVAHHKHRPAVVIGFAAETHDLLKYASSKLTHKGADAICANAVDDASRKRLGDGNNQVTWLSRARDGATVEEAWPAMSKIEIGHRIGDKIAALLLKK